MVHAIGLKSIPCESFYDNSPYCNPKPNSAALRNPGGFWLLVQVVRIDEQLVERIARGERDPTAALRVKQGRAEGHPCGFDELTPVSTL